MALQEGKGSERRTSLDEVVASERTVTRDQFLDVIDYADALRRFDEEKKDEKLLSQATEYLNGNEKIPHSFIHQAARELSIPEEYMEKALAIRDPSVEEQIADIKHHGAIPTIEVIASTYKKALIDTLRANCPIDEFETDGFTKKSFYFKRILEEKNNFLFWERTLKYTDCLASFHFFSDEDYQEIPKGSYGLKISLKDPLFLRGCGDTLEKLNEEFKDRIHFYDIRHDYHVE